ncbi:carbohydrate kinase family protein [Streptomyces noboritoensis]|uniref:Carbohydrate kinase family protein n=1 Tax=Streptomyces noboritoensis TaxID=67337 RepID=A0ABV6TFW9_9ACTN
MTALPAWDLACFSYLAHAQILHVARYPAADRGAPVDRSRTSLAGDGPITATVASSLGLRTVLVSNAVGDDLTGQAVTAQLHASRVEAPLCGRRPAATPHLTVITDALGTRTWFADLAHVHDSLHHADKSPLARARLAYIDCYTVIAPLAARAIDTAATANVPLLLNLGNDPIHPAVADAALRATVLAVQTGLPEDQIDQADPLARDTLERLRPQAAIVTLGAHGAIALTRGRGTRLHVPARQVRVTDTHGAGAAFSAALAAAYLDGHDQAAALDRACAAGTAHCTTSSATVPASTAPTACAAVTLPREEVPLCSPTT